MAVIIIILIVLLNNSLEIENTSLESSKSLRHIVLRRPADLTGKANFF